MSNSTSSTVRTSATRPFSSAASPLTYRPSIIPTSAPGYRVHNCSAWPDVTGDPDIAGTGVIVGFMLSAYLTLILVILRYISSERGSENPIDQRFIRAMQPKAWNRKSRKTWTQAMEASVLALSDTQLITGAAILLSGYTQLDDGLSSYHWEMVVCLAWFSSLTHLATLSSLRGYFEKWPLVAGFRAGFMGVVLILLAVSCGTTGYIYQYNPTLEQFSWPAQCLFSSASMKMVGATDIEDNSGNRPLFNKPFIVLSIMFLVVSYLTRVVSIFAHTAVPAKKWLKDIPLRWLKTRYTSSASNVEPRRGSVRNAFWKAESFRRGLVYIICKALFDIGGSMLWEIVWLIAALAWGTVRLVSLRYNAHSAGINDEDQWSFGQILPVLLTALPVCSIFNTVHEKEYEQEYTDVPMSATPEQEDKSGLISDHIENKCTDVLEVSDCAWFYRMVVLIYGFALFFIGSVIYNFPAAAIHKTGWLDTDMLEDPGGLAMVAVQYIILFSLCSFIVVVFAMVCLAIRVRTLSLSPSDTHRGNMGSSLTPFVQELMWSFLIGCLILGVVAFDFFIFDSNHAKFSG